MSNCPRRGTKRRCGSDTGRAWRCRTSTFIGYRQYLLTYRSADSVDLVTLLGTVQSLGIVEIATVSWINVRQIGAQHVAIFTSALLLPLSDPLLPEELRRGPPRFWPDQKRLLDSTISIADQIQELHLSKILGSVESVRVAAAGGKAPAIWIIQTHAGSEAERDAWLRSVIALEGRPTVG